MPLHNDDDGQPVVMEDGRVIHNLTDEQYDATYAEGEPHTIPADVLDAAIARAEQISKDVDDR
jgi:hypothetical protein